MDQAFKEKDKKIIVKELDYPRPYTVYDEHKKAGRPMPKFDW